jgi:Ca2+-binding RTX toxin-like protein
MRRLVAASVLLLTLLPRPAAAAVGTSCSFDAATATVTAIIGSGDAATLVRSGDEIWFGGAQCEAADVHNTDTIDIEAPDLGTTESLTISESGGAFVPGKTVEADGSDEIEIDVAMNDEPITIEGTPGDDEISAGRTGADLLTMDGHSDPEVNFSPDTHSTLKVLGGSGSDHLEILAHDGTLEGGPGHDTLVAGISEPAIYDGGAGRDIMTYPGSLEIIVHGATANSATIDRSGGTDTLVGLETIQGGDAGDFFIASDQGSHFVGGEGDDFFVGGAGEDLLVGGPDRDGFVAQGGDDTVRGGSGFDALSMQELSANVTVDFDAHTVGGQGSDVFGSIEKVIGSPRIDLFEGDPRTAHVRMIDGGGGRDTINLRAATRRQFILTVPADVVAVPSWVRVIVQDVRRIIGGPERDRIEVGEVDGAELHALFVGEGGRDRLVGGAHQDILLGGPGRDRLNGQGKRDTCDGGPGADVLVSCEIT